VQKVKGFQKACAELKKVSAKPSIIKGPARNAKEGEVRPTGEEVVGDGCFL
jgi:hypothetical protein